MRRFAERNGHDDVPTSTRPLFPGYLESEETNSAFFQANTRYFRYDNETSAAGNGAAASPTSAWASRRASAYGS